jgi:hypothetical protein
MEHVGDYESGQWVPYFALCLFAGIRPSAPHGEITKLKPEAVDLDAGVISVSAEVSKVREPRKGQSEGVELCPLHWRSTHLQPRF